MGRRVRWMVMAAGLAPGIGGVAFTHLIAQKQRQAAGRGMMQGGVGGMIDGGNMREMMQRRVGGRRPPGTDPRLLPDARSRGARLLQRHAR